MQSLTEISPYPPTEPGMCIDYKGESTVCLGEGSQSQAQEGQKVGGGGGSREKDQHGNEKKTHG